MSRSVRPLREFVWALAGPIVWAGHFMLVYGVEAVICTRTASPVSNMRWIVTAATLAAVGALALLVIGLFRQRRRAPDSERFLRDLSLILALVSIGAIVGVAATGLILPACTVPAG